MSMLPVPQSQFNARDLMFQSVASRMNQDGTEQDISHVFVSRIAGDVAVDLAASSAKISETNARSLKDLEKLGYDKDSDLAKGQVHVSTEMNKVLVSIGQAVASRVR